MSATDTPPYVTGRPGDQVTAEAWNRMQELIHADIRTVAKAAADSVTQVPKADDAARVEGLDLSGLTAAVADRVLDKVRRSTGYMQLFKVLGKDPEDPVVIEHGLGTMPLVDVYELEYFKVACREDDGTVAATTTFYLHHSEEKRIRVGGQAGGQQVEVQPKGSARFGVPFADVLDRYKVPYSDTTSLDDLVTEFWKAFFAGPNDPFDDDQYCHSPWFERCCRERTTVRALKESGEWNDMVFQFRAWKSVNYSPFAPAQNEPAPTIEVARPANVIVRHHSDDALAIWFEGDRDPDKASPALKASEDTDPNRQRFPNELKVMVLLKV